MLGLQYGIAVKDRITITVLTSERLTFEPLNEAHVDALYEALSHPSVHQYIDAKDFHSRKALSNFVARVSQGPKVESQEEWLNLVCIHEGAVIGLIQATVHTEWAEIAFLFNPGYQGQGYASESVNWLAEYLRKKNKVGELWATTHPDNAKSVALLLRTSFLECQDSPREIASYDPGDRIFTLNGSVA